MLQIQDICKEYRTGTLIQKALDHVSLALRDNEFVAILGPSGSGKTTLLNIIGGLDRYDSGDLIINGISTKRYKDRDWDSYRNHTIGFVFQSYNLIPHQTVLANVELALTISGISGSERRQRAAEALRKVGLGDQMHKKPNQMSGGQMQRVAIARALVNDPDILLADEPTGALDTATSVQVMELLKEVANDRLVVMVTHNPELAEQYATRIVQLRDGHIISDTAPVALAELDSTPPVHKNMGHSSMSYLTALSLSFNNLRTKLARTILVAAAGSIGIIGIALIMSLSEGVNRYIADIEENTLLEYPLEIQNSSISLSSFIEMPEETEEYKTAEVKERRVVANMFSRVSSNDLASLRDYFEGPDSHVYDYAKTIEYKYNVTPLIYRIEGDSIRQVNPDTSFAALGFGGSTSFFMSSNFSTDVFNPLPRDTSLYLDSYEVKAGHWPENDNECVLVISQTGRITDLLLYTMGLKDSRELDKMVESFSAGENVEELTTPLASYKYEDFVGIRFKRIDSADCYQYDAQYNVWTDKTDDKKFMYDLVSNGEDLVISGVVSLKENADSGMLMPGIWYPEEMTRHVMSNSRNHEITRLQLGNTGVDVFTGRPFNEQSDDPAMDLSTLFTVNEAELAKVFSFDASKLTVDTSLFTDMDMSDVDLSGMDFSSLNPDLSQVDFAGALSNITIDINTQNLIKMFQDVVAGYEQYRGDDPETDTSKLGESVQEYLATPEGTALLTKDVTELLTESGIMDITPEEVQQVVTDVMSGYPEYVIANGLDPADFQNNLPLYLQSEQGQAGISRAIATFSEITADVVITQEQVQKIATDIAQGYQGYADTHEEKPNPEKIVASFQEYLQSDEGKKVLMAGIQASVNTEELQKQLQAAMGSMFADMAESMSGSMQDMMSSVMNQIGNKIANAMTTAMSQMADGMNNAFSIHPEAFANAISMNMTETELSELMASLMSRNVSSYDGNLRILGYADERKPYSIIIYPKDFEAKQSIISILDGYNERMEKEDEDKVITYTDTVGLLMSSVTDIINAISAMLIAFVAISLVVSSIMIGVITYISVLERKKEIGILRAIGASKRNISSVFNAETFIIGLLAGLIGIGTSLLLLIPGNMIIRHFTDANIVARLPLKGGVMLVLLSTVLTMIGGLIPSRKAAKSDPVTALRTE